MMNESRDDAEMIDADMIEMIMIMIIEMMMISFYAKMTVFKCICKDDSFKCTSKDKRQ